MNLPPDLGPQGQHEGATEMAIVKVTKEMAEAALRDIDWAATDVMTDEDIAPVSG